jgi:PAS domain S-box-containing protein
VKYFCKLRAKDKAESNVTKRVKPYIIKVVEGKKGEPLLDANSFGSGGDGVLVGDLWGYITDVNDAVLKMFGTSDKSEVVGKHILGFLVKDEKVREAQDGVNRIATGKSETKVFHVPSKTGEELALEVTIDFIRNKEGEQIGFFDIIRSLSNPQKEQV